MGEIYVQTFGRSLPTNHVVYVNKITVRNVYVTKKPLVKFPNISPPFETLHFLKHTTTILRFLSSQNMT